MSFKSGLISAFLVLFGLFTARAQSASPFSVSAEIIRTKQGEPTLSVSFRIPENHYLYADKIRVTSGDGAILAPAGNPVPITKHDPFLEKEVSVYEKDVSFYFRLNQHPEDTPFTVAVSYEGCNDTICFLPAIKEFSLNLTSSAVATPSLAEPAEESPGLEQFTILGRATGYMKANEFIRFLEKSESGEKSQENFLKEVLQTRSLWIFIILVLAGGLALNLTPCVLPMIPINLAIIGAGAQAGSRGRGFLLGGVYGAGIAFAYGLLGLLVVLTGAKFGTLNASPWFNLGIGLVFGVMALAMFDVITIDLSRFTGQTPGGKTRAGSFLTAFVFGVIAALLAGACVAPVVIAVLLLSSDLYAGGQTLGLFLPFLLGAGMALPWPFAGAGLSFLPKPGKWMEIVKYGFGIIILLFSIWYVYQGISMLRDRSPASRAAVASAQQERIETGWLTSLDEALRVSARENKPLFIDFWATWCKNCLHMDRTTFKDPAVLEKMNAYVKLKYQAEDLKDQETRQTLDRFGVIGLPTYVVLQMHKTSSP